MNVSIKIAGLGLLLVLLVSCAADGTTPPADSPGTTIGPGPTTTRPDLSRPVAGDRSPVFTETARLVVAESFPVQVSLAVSGDLPTPCHQIGWDVIIEEPTIEVKLYSVADPDVMCIQVLEPFDVSIPLGSFAEGDWTVVLDGEAVGGFTP